MKIIMTLTLLSVTTGVLAQTPAALKGDWAGVMAQRFRLVLQVGDSVNMKNLDQPGQLLPATLVESRGGYLISVPSFKVYYQAYVSADGATLNGWWTQNGATQLFTMRRGVTLPEKLVYKRPQTPAPPFPYRVEEVEYTNSAQPDVRLAGTLTLPQSGIRFPAVILVTGSGPQDRDESFFGHRPFLLIADALTRRGIAVLRVDDRWVGRSKGGSRDPTIYDIGADVAAGVAYLRSRAEIDPDAIGVLGHSLGGTVAPMVVEKDSRIIFVVLLSAPAVKGREHVLAQDRAIKTAMNIPAAIVDSQAATNAAALDVLLGPGSSGERESALRKLLSAAGFTGEELEGRVARSVINSTQVALRYDPTPTLRKLRIPTLALYAERDRQVPPGQNVPAMRSALAANKKAEIFEIPGLNHAFQSAQSGLESEYSEIEETMAPTALNKIVDWIAAVVSQK